MKNIRIYPRVPGVKPMISMTFSTSKLNVMVKTGF